MIFTGCRLISSIAVAAVCLTACGPGNPVVAHSNVAPREVRVTRAATRPMERTVNVVGTLAAREEATIAAQVAGQLEKNYVDVGDRVRASQEIAQIDTAAYDALARASAANLDRAIASAANAAQGLKRVQDLQQERIASASDLDNAVAEAARTRSEVRAADAADAIARLNLDRSRVKAPFDGIVAERIVTSGDYLAVGSPIVRLVQTDPLRLRLLVPERESVHVRVGQPVRLTVEGKPKTYTGRLARVSPAIREADRMLMVEADVPNPDELRAGLFARAQIVVNDRDEAVSVPPNALITFAGLEKVVIVKEGKAVEQTVTTGRRAADWVEITSGLDVGAEVVLDPGGIRSGQPVIIKTK